LLSLDSSQDGTRKLADRLPMPEADDDGDLVLDELDSLADAAQKARDKAAHSAVRRACWNTLATIHGAPPVSGPVAKNRVTQARTIILRHPEGAPIAMGRALGHAGQGVHSVLTAALFTPFEGVDDEGREQIVDLLRRYRPHAVELWSAALSAASAAFYQAT
jgi:hypothetical protein